MRALSSVKGAVITAGALAVAISAIIALVPKGSGPPATLAASFVPPIQVYPDTSLDEYAARVRSSTTASVTTTGGGRLPSYHLAADTTSVVTTNDSTASSDTLGAASGTSSSETTTTNTATSSTESSASSTSTTSTSSSCTATPVAPGSTSSTTSTGLCRSAGGSFGAARSTPGLHILGSAPDAQNVAQQIPLVLRCPQNTHRSDGRCAPDAGAPCPPSGCTIVSPDTFDPGSACTADIRAGQCGAAAEINRALSDGVEPAAAAQRIVTLFAASRGEVSEHTVHPLGVMVTFEADLVGFTGTPATIRWSMFSADPARHLDPQWYQTVPVLSVTPDSNDDRFSSQFWVPEPRRRGDYYIRLEVDSADHLVRTYSDSPIFH